MVGGYSSLALSLEDLTLQVSLAKPPCWARAHSNLPALRWRGWGQLLKEGAALTHTSVLPILASSRKGTPHAASPPEVNVTTTSAFPSLAFLLCLRHIGVEVGDGELISGLRFHPPERTSLPSPHFYSLYSLQEICLPRFSSFTLIASPAFKHLQGPSLCCV